MIVFVAQESETPRLVIGQITEKFGLDAKTKQIGTVFDPCISNRFSRSFCHRSGAGGVSPARQT
jgi:hypothetical protein